MIIHSITDLVPIIKYQKQIILHVSKKFSTYISLYMPPNSSATPLNTTHLPSAHAKPLQQVRTIRKVCFKEFCGGLL